MTDAPLPAETERSIAFLRAINVGGHVVAMARLRALFEELGLAEVATFIASGNVIFTGPAGEPAELERRIEAHLRAALGYEVATFIRTTAELAQVAVHQPFPVEALGAEASTLFIAFLARPPGAEAERRLLAQRGPHDDFAVLGREAYWLRRGSSDASRFSGALLERAIGGPATMRNATTVRRLAAKYPPGP